MKFLQQILTAVDFESSTDRVIENSIFLAKKFNSQVTLLHVIAETSLKKDLKKIMEESLVSRLKELAQRIISEGIDVKNVVVEFGVPFEKIIHMAQNNDYNVIVAGSGNKPELDSYKLGTTVEKIMRKNQIPLWVVKNETFSEISKIACPVDFSDASERALNNAISLADKFGAELCILNVYSPVNISSTRFEVDNNRENIYLKETQEKEFLKFLQKFNLKNTRHKIEVLEGDPSNEILNYITSNKIDLLLMGTTGRTGLSRLLMGSITEKVTREVPCSFITTKAKDITDSYLESNLQSIESILNAARLLSENREYEKAIEKYQIALKQYPDNIPVILGLIESYKKTEKPLRVKHYQEYAREVVKRIWGDEYLEKLIP